jgi:hypothetical protein
MWAFSEYLNTSSKTIHKLWIRLTDPDDKTPREENYRLEELLQSCYTRECADVRDRIFGIQGLVRLEYRVQVDYTLSRWELYQQVLEILDKIDANGYDRPRFERCVSIALEIRAKDSVRA